MTEREAFSVIEESNGCKGVGNTSSTDCQCLPLSSDSSTFSVFADCNQSITGFTNRSEISGDILKSDGKDILGKRQEA